MFKYSALLAFVSLMPAVMGQVQVWGQCGGIGYSGSTTCASGSACNKVNDYYSQCQCVLVPQLLSASLSYMLS